MKTFKAPLESRVTMLAVQPGEAVFAGQVIASLTPLQMEELKLDIPVPAIRSPIDGFVVIYPNIKEGAVVAADAPVFSIATESEKAEAVRAGGMEIRTTGLIVHMEDGGPLPQEGAARMPVTAPPPSPPAEDAAAARCALGPLTRKYGRGAGSFALGYMAKQEAKYQVVLGWKEVAAPLKSFPANLNLMTDDHIVMLVVMAKAYLECRNTSAAATLFSLVAHELIAHGHEFGRDASDVAGAAVCFWAQQRDTGIVPRDCSPTTEAEFVKSLRTDFGYGTCEDLFGELDRKADSATDSLGSMAAPIVETAHSPGTAAPRLHQPPESLVTSRPSLSGWWLGGGAVLFLMLLFWRSCNEHRPLPVRQQGTWQQPRGPQDVVPDGPAPATPPRQVVPSRMSSATRTTTKMETPHKKKHNKHRKKHKKKHKHSHRSP